MLSDFGLSPKSRKFVSKAPGPKRDNPFAFLDDDYKTEAEKKADQERWDATLEKHGKIKRDIERKKKEKGENENG